MQAQEGLKADEVVGYNIMLRACPCSADDDLARTPAKTAASSARRVLEGKENFGYNAATDELRRPGQGRRHRPDQGHPHGAAKRRQRCDLAAHQRCVDRRKAERKAKKAGHGGDHDMY